MMMFCSCLTSLTPALTVLTAPSPLFLLIPYRPFLHYYFFPIYFLSDRHRYAVIFLSASVVISCWILYFLLKCDLCLISPRCNLSTLFSIPLCHLSFFVTLSLYQSNFDVVPPCYECNSNSSSIFLTVPYLLSSNLILSYLTLPHLSNLAFCTHLTHHSTPHTQPVTSCTACLMRTS